MSRPTEWLRLYLPGLPLATCREIAAHLRQVTQQAQVILRSGPVFDSRLDQVECIAFAPVHDPDDCRYLYAILLYYAARYRETPGTENDQPRLSDGKRELTLIAEADLSDFFKSVHAA